MSTRVAARAIRDHVSEAQRRQRNVFRARVTGVKPLRVEMVTSGLVLDEDDDFALTGGLTAYDEDHAIRVGDTLLLVHEAGDYTAFDVEPAKRPKRAKAADVKAAVAAIKSGVLTALEGRATALEGRATSLEGRAATLESNVTALAPYVDTFNVVGPWGTGSPGPTTGIAFTLPRAGKVLFDCSVSGYVLGQTPLTVEIWIDGVFTGRQSNMSPSNSVGVRLTMPTVKFTQTLAAGTHYIAYKQTAGVSDAADPASISVLLP